MHENNFRLLLLVDRLRQLWISADPSGPYTVGQTVKITCNAIAVDPDSEITLMKSSQAPPLVSRTNNSYHLSTSYRNISLVMPITILSVQLNQPGLKK